LLLQVRRRRCQWPKFIISRAPTTVSVLEPVSVVKFHEVIHVIFEAVRQPAALIRRIKTFSRRAFALKGKIDLVAVVAAAVALGSAPQAGQAVVVAVTITLAQTTRSLYKKK
jgi:hypothetical protein